METETLYIILGVVVVLNLVLFFMFASKKKSGVSRPKTAPVQPSQPQSVNYNEYNKTVALNNSTPMGEQNRSAAPKSDERTAILQAEKIRTLTPEDREEVRRQAQGKPMETQVLSPEPEIGAAVEQPTEQRTEQLAVHYKEKDEQKTFTTSASVINVGRDPEACELVLTEDPFVGRNHAIILKKQDRFYVVDLESKNGTFMNGERITGQNEVKENKPFTIGKTEMVIKVIGG